MTKRDELLLAVLDALAFDPGSSYTRRAIRALREHLESTPGVQDGSPVEPCECDPAPHWHNAHRETTNQGIQMNLDELTLGQVKEISRLTAGATASSGGRWKIGNCYFIRTVTHHLLGRLEEVTEHELWMSSVSWIADDGRFNELLAKGTAGEVEPAPEGDVAIGRGSLIDAYTWPHALLRSVK